VSRVIAFFDFDGTVTRKDTLLEFIRYVKGDLSFIIGFLIYSPVLVLYKLQIVSNQRAKEIMLAHFFGKMPVETFNRYCKSFENEVLPVLVRPKALREINRLKEAQAEVVIVSASPANWVGEWCASMKLKCIATGLVVKDSKLTGRIDGSNCHGKEKVRRINTLYNLAEYSSVYAYGDTSGDKYMLDLAHYKFYKPFR
jgi:phosphatidylglycerophosphatase C